MTTIWLVRHGRTEANASGLLLGRLDPPLDDVGREQARALASVVPRASRVVSSPLNRALQTAELLGRGPIEVDERWTEIDYGDLDGRALSDVANEVWAEWRRDPDLRPGGGESLTDVSRRVHPACEDLRKVDEAQVVVVSHVTPIKLAVAWALGTSELASWRMHLGVAAVSRLEVGTAGAVVHSFNDTCHREDR